MSQSARQMLGWVRAAEDRRLVHYADVRPAYRDTLPDQPDLLGRKQGHWMGGLTYALSLAQIGIGLRQVPSDFWSLTITDDGYPCAVVACQCGQEPAPEALGPMVRCDGAGCVRHFFFDGANVWVFYDHDPHSPEAPADPPE